MVQRPFSRFFAGRHEFQILGRMAGIFRRANSSHIAVILSGARNRFNHDALKALVSDKIATHTTHDYCAYQTSLPADTKLPILGSQTILSNLTLTSQLCSCGTSEHYDIRTMHAGASKEQRYHHIAHQFHTHFVPQVEDALKQYLTRYPRAGAGKVRIRGEFACRDHRDPSDGRTSRYIRAEDGGPRLQAPFTTSQPDSNGTSHDTTHHNNYIP